MIIDTLPKQGDWLFRWRSYMLFCLSPLILLAIGAPEPVEANLGALADHLFETGCLALAFAGLAMRVYCVGHVPAGTSGRNTRRQIAETLNTTGLYSLTRNPLYLANSIIYMSFALFTQNIFFVSIMGLFLVLYLERIIATEERFLVAKFGDAYLQWARQVPAFFPRLHGWQAPELGFSWKSAIRREYSGLFAIVVAFFALDQLRESITHRAIFLDPAWLAGLAAGTVFYFTVRTAKKMTKRLDVAGR